MKFDNPPDDSEPEEIEEEVVPLLPVEADRWVQIVRQVVPRALNDINKESLEMFGQPHEIYGVAIVGSMADALNGDLSRLHTESDIDIVPIALEDPFSRVDDLTRRLDFRLNVRPTKTRPNPTYLGIRIDQPDRLICTKPTEVQEAFEEYSHKWENRRSFYIFLREPTSLS